MANPLDLNSITDADQLDGLYNSDLSSEETINTSQKAIDAGNTKLLKSFLDIDKVSDKYDGLISQIGKGKGNEYAVLKSNQIKNTDNLNPTSNDDSRYSKGLDEKTISKISTIAKNAVKETQLSLLIALRWINGICRRITEKGKSI
ncbi:MAG: hypothetical protein EOM64_07000 [Erysipelotrichia bacterium]|nr:hypothetical protein [Erysipelotrichia bacterium]